MLDKMEPDHIFLLTVRLLDSVFICVYLIALSLCYWLGWGWLYLAHMPSSLTRAPYLEPRMTQTQPLAAVSSQASSGDGVQLTWVNGQAGLPRGYLTRTYWKGGANSGSSSLCSVKNKGNRTVYCLVIALPGHKKHFSIKVIRSVFKCTILLQRAP